MASYELKNLPFYKDILSVLDNKNITLGNKYTVTISTINDDIPAMSISSIDVIRDYKNAIGDTGFLAIRLPIGDYIYKVYPFKDNLEVTITNTNLTTSTTITTRYKALVLVGNVDYNAQLLTGESSDSAILKDIADIQLQIVERVIEPLRIKTTQGSYRNVKLNTLLNSVLSSESNKILVDGRPILDGIDIVKSDNDKVYKNVTIRSGTEIIDLPEIAQRQLGGIYNSGLGSYIQQYNGKKIWFTYPVYKSTRIKDEKKLLIIYSADSQVLRELDTTYYVDNDVVKIISNKSIDIIDNSGNDKIQSGGGFRMANADSFMKKPIIIDTDGKIRASKSNLNYEVSIENRNDGLNYAPITKASTNPYVKYSEVLAKTVIRADIPWDNSNMDLLYPGMPCKLMKPIGNTIKELDGILVFVQTYIKPMTNEHMEATYRSTSQLTVLLQASPHV